LELNKKVIYMLEYGKSIRTTCGAVVKACHFIRGRQSCSPTQLLNFLFAARVIFRFYFLRQNSNGPKVVLAGKLCTFTSYLPPEST
jgi:hypothetical protein